MDAKGREAPSPRASMLTQGKKCIICLRSPHPLRGPDGEGWPVAAEDYAGGDVRTSRGVSWRVFRVRSLPDTKTNAFMVWECGRMTSDNIPATQTSYISII